MIFKPDLQNERNKLYIYECGGVVEEALYENNREVWPFKIYEKGKDSLWLAILRSYWIIEVKKIE